MKSSTAALLWAAETGAPSPLSRPLQSAEQRTKSTTRGSLGTLELQVTGTLCTGASSSAHSPTEQQTGTGSFPLVWLEGLICLPGLIACTLKIN